MVVKGCHRCIFFYAVTLFLINFVICDPADFFPQDKTSVTWAHAVNSRSLLNDALSNTTVRMLEADLLLGTVEGNPDTTLVPIMAHPPAKTSDLSFVDFIDQIIAFNDGKSVEDLKGIKLDFKTIDVVEPVLETVQKKNITSFPVWLNADVLTGPGGGEPVEGVQFVTLCQKYLPFNTMSLGWTTGAEAEGYSKDNIEEMMSLLKDQDIKDLQMITFPVRSNLAVQSADQVLKLVNLASTQATLTMWSAPTDNVDLEKFRNLVFSAGKRRVFVDVPFQWKDNSQSVIRPALSLFIVCLLFTAFMI